jgi:hypothetical protein
LLIFIRLPAMAIPSPCPPKGDAKGDYVADAAARALTSPALLSRPLPPSLTGRGGGPFEEIFADAVFPSPGEGGWEGTGEG